MKKVSRLLSYVAWPILGVVDMKMVLISGTVAIVIGVVAYVILVNSGMDTASVYSGPDVRL